MTDNKHTLSRRMLLKRGFQGAGGLLILATGGLAYQVYDEDVLSPFDGPAYEPWTSWQTQPQAFPLITVQMAILAANPHNTQPWLFNVQADKVEIYADKKRHLGSFDPYRREMHIGLGCAIENIVQTASNHGYQSRVSLEQGRLPLAGPISSMEKVADVAFIKSHMRQPNLFGAIPKRHTDRNPYNRTKAISKSTVSTFKEVCHTFGCQLDVFQESSARSLVDQLINDATQALITDKEMVEDSHRWFRTTNDAVQTFRDGPTLDAAGLPDFTRFLAKTTPDLGPEETHRMWAKATKDSHLATAPLIGMISVPDRYDIAANLNAGQAWQRLHLTAAELGLSMQPLNQPVEWADRLNQLGLDNQADKKLQALLTHGGQPTFVFRAGYPTRIPSPSPRRPYQSCLTKGSSI